MVHFFFYNNLTHTELLNKIHPYHTIKIAYIYITEFNKIDNKLILVSKDIDITQSKKLSGLLIWFELTLEEILQKIENIDEIKYKNRNSYYLDIVKVYMTHKPDTDAYIIY